MADSGSISQWHCIANQRYIASQCVDADGLPYTFLTLSLNSLDSKTTLRVYLVDMVDSKLFEESISRLMKAAKVGLVGKGEALGREGVLSLLVLATEEEVFVFDILLLGVDGFKYGLYAVLHRPDLVKVIHDVRQLSDILFHQFQVTLVNVFDTMAAHLVVANWEADTPRQNLEIAPALEDTLRRFLKRSDLELEPLVTRDAASAAGESASSRWRLRSLPKKLLLEAAVSTFLLLPLADVLEQKLLDPVNRTSEELLDEVRTLSNGSEAEQAALTPQFNPDSMTVALPLWRNVLK